MTGHGKTASEGRHKARIFWQKAQRYARAAEANAAAGEFDPAVSNAVHAVINVADALCVHHLGKRSASAGHADALRMLHGLAEMDAAMRNAVAKRLGALLSVKSLAEYEGSLLREEDAREALQDMARALAAVAPFAQRQGWT